MLIDIILDRKDGQRYVAKDFYFDVTRYCKHFGCCIPVFQALDGGTEEDIKRELCRYVVEQGYNPEICEYINSVLWLKDDADPTKTLRRDDNGRACWVHVINVSGKFFAVSAHGWGTDEDMQREKWGNFEAARLFKKTATVHVYGLMQDGAFRHVCSANAAPQDEILSPFAEEAIHGTERPDGIEYALNDGVRVTDATDKRNAQTGFVSGIDSDTGDGHIIYTVVFPGCTETPNGTKFNADIGEYTNAQLQYDFTARRNIQRV